MWHILSYKYKYRHNQDLLDSIVSSFLTWKGKCGTRFCSTWFIAFFFVLCTPTIDGAVTAQHRGSVDPVLKLADFGFARALPEQDMVRIPEGSETRKRDDGTGTVKGRSSLSWRYYEDSKWEKDETRLLVENWEIIPAPWRLNKTAKFKLFWGTTPGNVVITHNRSIDIPDGWRSRLQRCAALRCTWLQKF